MTRKALQAWTAVCATTLILAIDQTTKVLVKTNMYLHESRRVTDWFYLVFTENDGMAFGIEWFSKIFLTSFRIVAVGLLAWYVTRQIKKGVSWGFLICLVSILAGAAGNIFDCVFYGMIFNEPMPPAVASFVPWGTGYGQIMRGLVVDMFYFPLVEWDWPSWLPALGGRHFIFFSPIFNVADAFISCGVIALVLFYNKRFRE